MEIPVFIENSNQPGQKFADELFVSDDENSSVLLSGEWMAKYAGRFGPGLIFQHETWHGDPVTSITIAYSNGITRTLTRR